MHYNVAKLSLGQRVLAESWQ